MEPTQPTEEQQMAAHMTALQAHIEARAAQRGQSMRVAPGPKSSMPRGSTPATSSSGGNTPAAGTTPPAGTSAGTSGEQAPKPPTPAAKRIEELRSPSNPDGMFSKDPAKQKAAVAEFNRLAASEMSAEERDAVMSLNVDDLRERFGIEQHVPEYLTEQWDADAEADYLANFAAAGLPADFARDSVAMYTRHFIGAGGDVTQASADAMEADFRALAKRHAIPQDVVDTLVKYERKRLGYEK